MAASITDTEVRFASPTLPLSSPTGPSTKLNTLLGGFVGLILMMGLALVVGLRAAAGRVTSAPSVAP